jgi:predicted transcriptional regulator YheO
MKKGILRANTVYILLAVLVLFGMATYLWATQNNAQVWADYYSKEITRIINLAQPEQTVTLDVHKATEIAKNNELSFDEIFQFDNSNNRVCVKLSKGRKTCYSYFNQIDIENQKIELASGSNSETNLLVFQTKSKELGDENQ